VFKRPAGIILLIFSFLGVAAQQPEALAVRLYQQSMIGSQHLYNGSEFIPYRSVKDEHPYYLRDELIKGNIKYDGLWYEQVPMRFDIERNSLIIEYYYNTFLLELAQAKIDEFILEGKRFVNVKSTTIAGLNPGFYEVLYEGKSLLYRAWSKTLHEQIVDNEIKRSYKNYESYFAILKGTAHKVSGMRGLSGLMEDRKKEVKAFLKADRNASMSDLLGYYDSLNH
jgi:hypothetical protein